MARKTKQLTIDAEGRDAGKIFLLTEMPASRAEKWATRALLAMARSGEDISQDAIKAGFLAVMLVGVHKLLSMDFADAEPLLDEMMACVEALPGGPGGVARPLIEDDIEEVSTRLLLRSEVLELHVGFSVIANLRTFGRSAMRQMDDSLNSSTSPPSSEPSSLVGTPD